MNLIYGCDPTTNFTMDHRNPFGNLEVNGYLVNLIVESQVVSDTNWYGISWPLGREEIHDLSI